MALALQVMGVVNTTPDSFFPGSRTRARDEAIARGREMFRDGASVVDVGGESTRPGAEPVSVDEECERVVEVVSVLSAVGRVSIDTQKEEVARAAIAAGATILNDVSATLWPVAADTGVGYVAMHRQGDSRTMQDNPLYDDVVAEVHGFLERVGHEVRASGVTELWLDPGIGFGKTVSHNLSLLKHLDDLVARAQGLGAGVLLGTSRKRFLADLGAEHLEVEDRLEATLGTIAWGALHGVSMVRVHDVPAAVRVQGLITVPTGEVRA